MIITIDGPTASGKSTASRALAKRMNAYYIYSGLLYRACAYILIQHELLKPEDLADVSPKCIQTYLNSARFLYRYDDQFQERVFFDKQDITSYLFEPLIDQAASILSTNEHARSIITQSIRRMAHNKSVVVDGRDAGSHIFPEADVKFYITAEVPIRAARWQAKQRNRGEMFNLGQAQDLISERDQRDAKRDCAPLQIPLDAIVIDNSNLTEKQTLEKILESIHDARSE